MRDLEDGGLFFAELESAWGGVASCMTHAEDGQRPVRVSLMVTDPAGVNEGFVALNMDEARKFSDELLRAIAAADENRPPAPLGQSPGDDLPVT